MSINILNVDTNDFGYLRVDPQPRLGSSITIVTHNFADKCSWAEKSVEVIDEIAVNSGDNKKYTLSNDYIVDTEHGRITFENNLDSKYKINVRVNDIPKVVDVDFTVNYELGEITFNSALSPSDVVKVSYYYVDDVEGNSIFTIKPEDGKMLIVIGAELQFSENVEPNFPNIHFKTYMDYPPYGVIPVRDTVYKNIKDLINESNNGSWIIEPIAGLSNRVRVFPFNYPSSKVIKSSLSMRVESFVEGPNPIKSSSGGTLDLATASFYCLSQDDPDWVG